MAKYAKIASIPGRALQVADLNDHEANVQAEIAYWQRQLEPVVCDQPDLIVTPECCDRPLGISREGRLEYYRVRGNRVRDFFAAQARKYHANIAYSAVYQLPDGTYRNAIQMINRQGEVIGSYNKYLLVIEENTQCGILYGKNCQAMQTDIGRVCGAICFDLNFEEPLKLTAAQKPELTLFTSNYHGGIMQNLWAYLTRSYFVTCIGGTQTASIINPVGEVIAQSSNYFPYLSACVNLDYQVAHLDHNIGKFRAMKARYGDGVEMRTPYGLGCALLTCNLPDKTMKDIVQEFDIELWDDYYARSMAARYVPGRIEE